MGKDCSSISTQQRPAERAIIAAGGLNTLRVPSWNSSLTGDRVGSTSALLPLSTSELESDSSACQLQPAASIMSVRPPEMLPSLRGSPLQVFLAPPPPNEGTPAGISTLPATESWRPHCLFSQGSSPWKVGPREWFLSISTLFSSSTVPAQISGSHHRDAGNASNISEGHCP